MNLEKLALNIVQQANDRVIDEKTVVSISDSNNLSLLEFSKLCDILTEIGITIDDKPTNNFDKDTNSVPDNISEIVSLFNKLSLEDQRKCYALLSKVFNSSQKNTDNSSEIKDKFLNRIAGMKLQYSYIAVLLKAFFDCNNYNQSVDLQKIIDFYRSYYSERKNKNLKVEQDDSIFTKPSYYDTDIRKNILFNPMKRSFLANYFSFDRKNNLIIIDSDLYKQLSQHEITEIIEICNHKLEEYYKRIT